MAIAMAEREREREVKGGRQEEGSIVPHRFLPAREREGEAGKEGAFKLEY